MASNNDFQIMLGVIIDNSSLSEAEKKIAKEKIKINADVDIENFAKSKAELEKQIGSLGSYIKKILGDSVSDKQANQWAKQYYDQMVSGAKQTAKSQEDLVNAMARGREKSEELKRTELERQSIAQNNAINKALEEEYDQRVKIAEKAKEIKLNVDNDGDTGLYSTQLSKMEADLQKYSSTSEKAKEKVNELRKVIAEMSKKDASDDSLVQGAKKLKQGFADIKVEIDKAKLSYDKLQQPVGTDKIASLQNKIQNFMSKNTAITQDAKNELQKYINELNGGNISRARWDEINAALAKTETNMRSLGRLGKSLKDQLSEAKTSFLQWVSVSSVIMGITYRFKEAISGLNNLDSILTEINKTSDLTISQLDKLGNSSFDAASKYGRTAEDYLTSVQEMSRSGFYGGQAEEMAKLSLLTQSAGDMSEELADQFILSSNAAYSLGGNIEKLTELIDGANEISNHYSTNLSDISIGMSKAGSVASTYKVTMNQLAAIIGTASSATKKSGEEIGNAVKSIFVNLQNLSSSKISNTFNSLGISMTKMVNGSKELKTPIELLEELQKIYNDVNTSSVDKSAILTNIFGKYQANVGSAILQNWETYKQMLDTYASGTGSASEEADKSANNIVGSFNKINNAFTELVNTIYNRHELADLLQLLSSGINTITDFTNAFGLIPTIVSSITIAKSFKKGGLFDLEKMQQFIVAYKSTSTSIEDITAETKGLTAAQTVQIMKQKQLSATEQESILKANGFSEAQRKKALAVKDSSTALQLANAKLTSLKTKLASATVTVKAFATSMLATAKATAIAALTNPFTWISIGISLFEKLKNAIDKANPSLETMRENLFEDTENYEKEKEEIQSLESELNSLKNKMEEIQSMDGVSVSKDGELEKLKLQTAELEAQLNIKREQAELDGIKTEENAVETINKKVQSKISSGYDESGMPISTMVTRQEEVAMAMDRYNQASKEKYDIDSKLIELTKERSSLDSKTSREYYKISDDIDELSKKSSDLSSLMARDQKYVVDTMADLNEEAKSIYGHTTEGNATLSNIKELTISCSEWVDSIKRAEIANSDLSESEKELALAQLEESDVADESSDDKFAYADEVMTYVDKLNDAKDKLKSGKLTQSDVFGLLEEFPELAPYIDTTASGFGNLAKGLEEVSNVKLDSAIQSVKALLEQDPDNEQYAKLVEILESLSSSAKDVGNDFANMSDALDSVKNISEDMDKLNKAFKDFSDNKSFSMDSFIDMEGTFGNLESFDNFVSIAKDATSTTEDLKRATNDLVTEYIYTSGVLDNVNIATAETIAKGLEEQGVTNALDVALSKLSMTSQDYASVKEYCISKGIELENITYSEIEAFIAETNASDATRIALFNYVTEKLIANGTKLDTVADCNALANETKASEDTKQTLYLYALQKSAANNTTIKTDGDIANLYALARACGKAGDILFKITKLKQDFNSGKLEATWEGYDTSQLEDWYKSTLDKYNKELEDAVNGGGGTKDNSNSSTDKAPSANYDYNTSRGATTSDKGKKSTKTPKKKKETKAKTTKVEKQDVDYLSQSLENLVYNVEKAETALSNLESNGSNNFFEDKIKAIEKVNSELEKLKKGYSSAKDYYKESYNSALDKLGNDKESIQKKIESGKEFNIKSYNKSTAEKIQKAIDLYNKMKESDTNIKETNQKIKDNNREISDLKYQNYQDIQQGSIDLQKQSIDYLQNEIEKRKELGDIINSSDYDAIILKQNSMKKSYENMYNSMNKELKKLVKNGRIEEFSPEWYEWQQNLGEISLSIQDINLQLKDTYEELKNLKWDNFAKGIEKVEVAKDEISDMLDMLGDTKVDDNGNYTKDGLTALALYGKQINTNQALVNKYREALSELEKDYKSGKISQAEYTEKSVEFSNAMRDSAKAVQDAKQAIIDLKIEQLEAEKSAYDEVIKKQKDYLSKEREAYELAKKQQESNQSLARLKSKIAQLELNTDETDRSNYALLQQLKAELAEKEKQQEEDLFYEKNDAEQDALDEANENFSKAQDDKIKLLKSSTDEQNKVIKDSLSTTQSQYSNVLSNINSIASEYGITLTDTITSPWVSAQEEVKKYMELIGSLNDDFVGGNGSSSSLSDISEKIYEILNSANGKGEGTSVLNQAVQSAGYNQLSYKQMAELANLMAIGGKTNYTSNNMKSDTNLKNLLLEALQSGGYLSGIKGSNKIASGTTSTSGGTTYGTSKISSIKNVGSDTLSNSLTRSAILKELDSSVLSYGNLTNRIPKFTSNIGSNTSGNTVLNIDSLVKIDGNANYDNAILEKTKKFISTDGAKIISQAFKRN